MKNFKNYKGFTLLEILLATALIGLLASIVLVAINPTRQLGMAQDLQRQQDLSRLQQALDRYAIKNNGQYPDGILTGSYKEICPEGESGNECVDLSSLVPSYIGSIPTDPTGVNYKIGINPDNSNLSLWSENANSREVALNKFLLAAGAKDPGFNTGIPAGFNNIVQTISTQSDGKIIVAGYFSSYQGVSANKIIRLNSNGSIDTSFNLGMGFDYNIETIVTQSDGKIIVGGWFSTYQGQAANGIIRLNSDGSRDTTFNVGTGFDSAVNTIALQSDGKILVGGLFSTYQGQAANGIIRLNSNGSIDTTFTMGTGFDSDVNTIALQSDGKVLVGGWFSTYQGQAATKIIRLNSNGSIDTTFTMGTGFDSAVSTIALQSDGKVLVGGWFNFYQGQAANRIIRLNSNGSIDTTFTMSTGFDSDVNTIALQSDGKVLVGGWFSTYQGQAANRIIRLNSNGSRDTTFNMGTGFDSDVNTIALQSDGKVLVGGWFSTYQGQAANKITRLNSNGSIDSIFNVGTGFDSDVNTIALQSDGKILVGGSFSSYQGQSANRIIRLNSDGSRDTSFDTGTGFNSGVETMIQQYDGKIIVGGSFSTYQGVSANRIIRLNSDGSRDGNFNLGTGFSNGSVNTLTLQSDGKIVVGGGFTSYQGQSANKIIRLNSGGSRDDTFNIGTGFNNTVNTIVLQSDGKIVVGGVFSAYQGVTTNRIIRLNSGGSMDDTFNIGTGFNLEVSTLALQNDGKIVVGGGFTSYQGQSANKIIRLNSDGSRDASFDVGTGFNNFVLSIAIQDDGKILVGGEYITYQSLASGGLIRLNSDGSRDVSFDVGTGFSSLSSPNIIKIQTDGKIFVGGDFTSYQNQPAGYLIRVFN